MKATNYNYVRFFSELLRCDPGVDLPDDEPWMYDPGVDLPDDEPWMYDPGVDLPDDEPW